MDVIVRRLEQDEVFAQQLLDSQDVETVHQICSENSIALTHSEAETLFNELKASRENADDMSEELDLENLAHVTGGIRLPAPRVVYFIKRLMNLKQKRR